LAAITTRAETEGGDGCVRISNEIPGQKGVEDGSDTTWLI
jgi:hypothetical protein